MGCVRIEVLAVRLLFAGSVLVAGVVLLAGVALAPAAAARSAITPRLGRTEVVSRVSGVVRVKPAGVRRFRVLSGRLALPVGSTVDASHGKVKLVTADVGPGSRRTRIVIQSRV